jgi:phosphocarrier protein HPr
MKNFEFTLAVENGLHARPAGQLVKLCQSLKSSIKILKGQKEADAKRMFSVMKLDAHKDDMIQFVIEGETETADAQALQKFCREDL